MTTSQGKFDALTQQLITHVLGFKEGEENFIRSEQFVLSNLLYHHCLAVNSHAVRRSLDGLVLKFTIHGQHQRADRLKEITKQFLASPFFKDHYETDLEWSLLSLLLHLSNSPTQVPLGEGEGHQHTPQPSLHHGGQLREERQEEDVDWGAYLREDDPDYVLGPEEALSDWSGDEDSESTNQPVQREHTHPHTLPLPLSLSLPHPADHPPPPPHPTTPPLSTRNTLGEVQRAKSWVSAKTHIQYWGSNLPQELPTSQHPLANVATMCEGGTRGTLTQCHQRVSEWSVMREVVWSLMCPVSTHVFISNKEGQFRVREGITLPSLTPAATVSLLQPLCAPLQHLHTLDTFTHTHTTPRLDHPAPITLLAYASGLWHWRQALHHHLRALEDDIKDQENTCTLLWLEGELHPWLRTLAVLFTLHTKAMDLPPDATPRTTAMRLLGSLCEGVEGAAEGVVRGVLVRLLLHTLRPYLSIIHTWLLHGALMDDANEFIVHRDESVTVYDERFWHKAFTVNLQDDDDLTQNRHTQNNPANAILKILSPLLSVLTSVGKSQELLAALGAPPVPLQSHFKAHHTTEEDCSLEEVVVRHIKDTVCRPQEEEEEEGEGRQEVKEGEDSEGKEVSIKGKGTGGDDCCKKVKSVVRSGQSHPDPLLWAAFTETPQDNTIRETQLNVDHIASLIQDIGDIPGAVSVVVVVTSALQPLVRRRQEEVSAKLTQVLLQDHHLHLHCRAVRSVLLMEAGDVMHEFYSHLFAKLESGGGGGGGGGGEGMDSISLTLHLQYCVARLYPHLAQYFSVSLLMQRGIEEEEERIVSDTNEHDYERNDRVLVIDEQERMKKGTQRTQHSKKRPQNISSSVSLTRAGIPELKIHYQAPWPANLLLTEAVMKQYNKLFNFSLSLKRVTNGLERLKFKELSSWNLILRHESEEGSAEGSSAEESQTPLQSRLHRLQLLRQWLLCFSRELHDHFANTALLPFYEALDRLFLSAPPLNTIITEHEKLLNKLTTECLMGRDEKILPLQVVLNKVFWLTQRLSHLWLGDVSRVNVNELTHLENHYAQVHRYLVNFLTTLVSRTFTPHLEGLTRTLMDTVPLLTNL